MPSALKVTTIALKAVAGLGVTKIAADVIKKNTTVITKVDQLKVLTGGFVISAMAVAAVDKFVNDEIADLQARYKEFMEKREKESEETPDEDTKETE